MAAISRPEPMNATSSHAKVKVSLTLSSPVFVAGGNITGRMEMECRADKGLGIGVMMVELFAIQELTSRDHSATSTFLHSRRFFQGPGLPPSNAVQPHPVPGEPPFPSGYHQARRGTSTFLFKFPLPATSPSSINFGGDLARVRYELRASVGVLWKAEKRLVTDRADLQVVECFADDPTRPEPEGVVVGENGKIWAQGKVVGGVVVAGESGCVELQVKNHSAKKNTGLVITLTRTLVLCGIPASEKQPLQISDTLVTVPYRGPEYIIPPGAEGVASLVFDVPKHARGVSGGLLLGDPSAKTKGTQAIFEVRCVLGIKMTMGFGCKDIELELPVSVVHPLALPQLPPPPQQYDYAPGPGGYQPPYADYADPRATPAPYGGYMSPPLPTAYIDPQQSQVWLPPPPAQTPYTYYAPGHPQAQYYFPPPPTSPVYQPLPLPPQQPLSVSPHAHGPLPLNLARPLSAGGNHGASLVVPGQLPDTAGEEGKGERASRTTAHLRQSTRGRSASPLSHRYPLAAPGGDASRTSLAVAPVLSPRPVLSPKTSYTGLAASPKSERVEELERMADEVGRKTTNLSGDLPKSTLAPAAEGGVGAALSAAVGAGGDGGGLAPPPVKEKEKRRKGSKSPSKRSRSRRSEREKEKAEKAADKEKEKEVQDADLNKTLPGPPVPTGKVAPPAVPRARVDTYFDLPQTQGGADSAQLTPRIGDSALARQISNDALAAAAEQPQTPKTPTLTAMRGRGHGHGQGLGLGAGLVNSESGLDALERRLLYEVGTRKVPAAARPDVRSVVGLGAGAAPVDIPGSGKRGDSADESAISSLTLAGEVQEREQEREREKERERERDGEEEERDRDSDERTQGAKKSSSGRTERGDGERRSSRKKEKEKGKERKAAKGRVAAWLGGIDADPEVPPDPEVEPRAPSPDIADLITPLDKVAGLPDEAESGGTLPNPRSSGFVPVKTFRRDPFQRNPAEEAKRIADLWGKSTVAKDKSPAFPRVTPPTHTLQSVHTDRKVSPPSSPLNSNGAIGAQNVWRAVPSAAPPKVVAPSPRFPLSPPLLDSEVKYDIRSARGGRGGKVTSVASLWASGALAEKSKGPPPKPVTSPKPLTAPKPIPAPKPAPPPKPAVAAKPAPTTKPVVAPKPATAADFLRSIPKDKVADVAKPATAADFLRSIPKTDKGSTEAEKTAPPPVTSNNNRARAPVIKSASVPALVSSSHARPTLSSTASLARPALNSRSPPPRPAPTIAESASGAVAGLKGRVQTSLSSVPAKAPAPAASASKPGELAFGQAKLRDLIKKYQGQAAA